MATITITDSENVVVAGSATAAVVISISDTHNPAHIKTGLYRIGDYMVDRKGGTNTTIKTGDIIYGVGSMLPDQYIIAIALQDNPTLITHFQIKYND